MKFLEEANNVIRIIPESGDAGYLAPAELKKERARRQALQDEVTTIKAIMLEKLGVKL